MEQVSAKRQQMTLSCNHYDVCNLSIIKKKIYAHSADLCLLSLSLGGYWILHPQDQTHPDLLKHYLYRSLYPGNNKINHRD